MKANSFQLGLDLLRTRVDRAVPELLEFLRASHSYVIPSVDKWIVSGLGVSEAHARYLNALINNYTEVHSEFRSYSRLVDGDSSLDDGLMFFSQGFSANSLAVFKEWLKVGSQPLVIFTATHLEALKRKRDFDKVAVYEQLIDKGAQFVFSPELDEYTILIRVMGPLLGYGVALKWIRSFSRCKLPELDMNFFGTALYESVVETARRNLPRKFGD